MKRLLSSIAIIMLVLTPVAAQRYQKPLKPFTIDELLQVRRVGEPQISPDGRWIAYTIADTDKAANRRTTQIYLDIFTGRRPAPIDERETVFNLAALVARRQAARLCLRISNLDRRGRRRMRQRRARPSRSQPSRRAQTALSGRRMAAPGFHLGYLPGLQGRRV